MEVYNAKNVHTVNTSMYLPLGKELGHSQHPRSPMVFFQSLPPPSFINLPSSWLLIPCISFACFLTLCRWKLTLCALLYLGLWLNITFV